MTTVGTAVLVTLLERRRVSASRNPSNCVPTERSRPSPTAPMMMKFGVSTRIHLGSAATLRGRSTTSTSQAQNASQRMGGQPYCNRSDLISWRQPTSNARV
jgi:hypothetical protein